MKKQRFLLVAFLTVTIALSFSSFYVPTVKASPAYEDFTTYTEEDPTGAGGESGHIQFTAYHIDHDAYRNEDAYLYDDKGVDHFGDFEHLVDVRSDFLEEESYGIVWMLSNDVDDLYGLLVAQKTTIVLRFDSFLSILQLGEKYGVGWYEDNSVALSADTWYYLKIVKSGTSLVVGIYSTSGLRDAGDGTDGDVDNLALTLQADHLFRYNFACNTYHDDYTTNYMSNDIANLDLQEVGEEYERPASQSISVALSAARLFETSQTATQAIGIGLTTTRIPNFVRAATQTITTSLSADRLIEVTLQASQAISVSLSAERLIEVTKTASQAITIALEAVGFKEFYRSVAQVITVGLATIRIPDFARSATQAIGVGLNADRLIEVTRQATQTLGISVVGDRLIDVSRSVTQAINVALEAIGYKLAEYNRAANITLTFGHGIMGLFGDYATTGFVLATIFLLIFIGAPIVALIWRKR